jgi:hypothetical protein
MKKIYLLAFVSIFSFLSLSQTFAPDGAVWNLRKYVGMGQYEYIDIVPDGDTIVLGKTCRKILNVYEYFCSSRGRERYMYKSNDSLYMYDVLRDSFQLLTPYNAVQGDEWSFIQDDIGFSEPPFTPNNDTLIFHVDSTENIDVNGFAKNKLFVTVSLNTDGVDEGGSGSSGPGGDYQIEIVEDIGNLFGLAELNFDASHSGLVCEDVHGVLVCYTDPIIGTYVNAPWGNCDLYVGIEENNQLKLSIYPNPFQDGFQIETSDLHQIDEIIIRDISGKEVKRKVQNLSFISMNNLVSGMYFLEARKNGIQVAVQKIQKIS